MRDFLLIKRNRRCADIDRLPSIADPVFWREPTSISNCRANANFFRFHGVDRNQKFHAPFLRQVENFTRKIEFIRFHTACADRDSLRLKECICHGAADQNAVGLSHQRFQNTDFVGNLRSAQNDDERFDRFIEPFAQMFQLFLHQDTHRRFCHKFCDARCGRMGAMRRAERIVYIKITEFRECFREFRIVRFFLRLETDILEQSDIAILHVANDFFWNLTNCVVTENDGLMDKRMQIIADGTKG